MQCLLSCLSPDKICANKILIPASLVIVILETGPSRWRLNLQLIIETCRAQSELSIPHWSPTVLWTMFFFMSLSFFLLTLFSNPWIAPGHKSMWIRHLAYFKILATLHNNTHFPACHSDQLYKLSSSSMTKFIWSTMASCVVTQQTLIV